jgi:hypothetical protein
LSGASGIRTPDPLPARQVQPRLRISPQDQFRAAETPILPSCVALFVVLIVVRPYDRMSSSSRPKRSSPGRKEIDLGVRLASLARLHLQEGWRQQRVGDSLSLSWSATQGRCIAAQRLTRRVAR